MKCKHCIKAHDFPDVPGAEAGLMTHLAEKHGMKGQYLCVNCHSLLRRKKLSIHIKKNVRKTIQRYEKLWILLYYYFLIVVFAEANNKERG